MSFSVNGNYAELGGTRGIITAWYGIRIPSCCTTVTTKMYLQTCTVKSSQKFRFPTNIATAPIFSVIKIQFHVLSIALECTMAGSNPIFSATELTH